MMLTDPTRPQIAGRPAYGNPPIAALPNLSIIPTSPTHVRVGAMLCTAPGTFEWHHCETEMALLPGFFLKYYTDPEGALELLFQYKVPEFRRPSTTYTPRPAGAKAGAQSLLAELGL